MAVVFTAIGRINLQLRVAFAESVVELIASIVLVLAGAGATGAAFGRAIGYLAGGAATVALLVRALGPAILPTRARLGADARRIAGYAGILLVVDGAYTAFTQIDILIIGAYLGASSVGIFSAPVKLTVLLGLPGKRGRVRRRAAARPRAERHAQREGVHDRAADPADRPGRDHRVHPRMGAADGEGRAGAAIPRICVGATRAQPYIFLSGFGALVSMSANYLGRGAPARSGGGVTVLINCAMDLVLVPRIGVLGGAWGTDAAFALYCPAHLYICQRALHLDLRPTIVTFARTVLAGAALTGVLFLFGDSLHDLWMTALGGVVGIVVFGLVLWLTREVTVSEARDVLAGMPVARAVGLAGRT